MVGMFSCGDRWRLCVSWLLLFEVQEVRLHDVRLSESELIFGKKNLRMGKEKRLYHIDMSSMMHVLWVCKSVVVWDDEV